MLKKETRYSESSVEYYFFPKYSLPNSKCKLYTGECYIVRNVVFV